MRLYTARKVGNNCLPEHFRLLVSGPSGSGKTTFVEKLLTSDRLQYKPKHVYYCYPPEFDEAPVDWDKWEDTIVTFVPYLPDINFFKAIDKHSVVVFDDNFDQAIKSPVISQIMKIHSRRKFSVILITQMFYEQGSFARVIRNQLNGVVLYRNFGDIGINRTVAMKLGVKEQYLLAEKETTNKKFDPIVILSPEIVEHPAMRVQTSYLSDYSYCYI